MQLAPGRAGLTQHWLSVALARFRPLSATSIIADGFVWVALFGALLVLELTVKSFWCIVVATAVLALSFAARPLPAECVSARLRSRTQGRRTRVPSPATASTAQRGTADVSTVSPAQN
ncbi:hypothetical protein I552_6754 [Mycobacterium xenopi 3993]|nr:hypothetical protein I552_6754 [Mycobacterium xenopi 3993]